MVYPRVRFILRGVEKGTDWGGGTATGVDGLGMVRSRGTGDIERGGVDMLHEGIGSSGRISCEGEADGSIGDRCLWWR